MFLSIRDMGKIGLNTELPPYELKPNAFTRAENIRFWDGTAQRHPDPADIVAGGTTWDTQANPVWLEAWVSKDSTPQFVYATQTKLYLWDGVGASWNDATNTADFPTDYTSTSAWGSVTFGDTCVFNNGQDDPQMLEDGDTAFSKLTGWPADTKCKVIRKFKNFMVALGVSDSVSGTYYHNKILWSDEAETNSVPQSWDETDATTLAGSNTISADDGEIVDGFELGDVFIIYTKRAIYEMSFIGAPYVMAFRKISNNSLLNRNSIAVYDNFHFCVGEREIYIHDGQNIKHIADQRVRRTFFDSMVLKDSVKVEASPITKEIFILYNDDTSDNTGPATKALVWCYRYNTFTFVDMPGVECIKFGYLPGSVTTWDDLQSDATLWSELNITWAQFSSQDLVPTIFLLSSADNKIYQSDLFFSSSGSSTAILERKSLDLDGLLSRPTNTVKLIKQILPQITGSGTLTFTLGCHETPDGPVEWLQSQNYIFGDDYTIDLFAVGRYLAWKITAGAGTQFRLSGMDIDVEEVGER